MKMLHIDEKDNLILKACHEAKEKIYLYGAGKLGKIVADKLLDEQISIAGFLVDPKFWKKDEVYKNIPIISIDKIEIDNNIMIIVTAECLDENKIESLKRKTKVIDLDMYSFFEYGEKRKLDFAAFWEKNIYELDKLYHKLADNKSRECMRGFLNQKISGDFKYLQNVWEENQYYDNDIVDFSKIELFIDCGAYNGDSYHSFLENYEKHGGKEWTGKAYLLEPVSYDKCYLNYGTDKRCEVLRLAAWDKKDRLTFSVQELGSSVIAGNGILVDADTIDNAIRGGENCFIKMDIEGSELKALKGAEKTIKVHKPILAICVYHKREDLITIPQYIESICPSYKMYLRAYEKYAVDLVLYAIPQ